MTLKRSLKFIQTGTTRKIGCGFLFAFHSNYGRIFNRLRYSASKNSVTLKTGLGVVEGHWKRRRSIDHIWLSVTFYWSAIVNIALSCTVFDLTLNNIVTLKSGLQVTQGHSKCTIRKLGCGFLFAFNSNYGSILHQFRDKARYWSKIVIFSYPLHSTPPLGGPRRNIAIPFGTEKLEWLGYLMVKKLWGYV